MSVKKATLRVVSPLELSIIELLVGQDEAVQEIVPFIETFQANLCMPGRPIAVILLLGPTGTGKAQPIDAPVLTTSGWRPIGDIKVGNKVITPSNSVAWVTGVYPQGVKQIYKVTFADGRTAECCAEHLWKVFHKHWSKGRQWKVLPLSEIIERVSKKQDIYVQLPKPLEFSMPGLDSLPIPAYALGSLLGNGCFGRGIGFSDDDSDNVNNLAKELDSMLVDVRQTESRTGTYDYGVSTRIPHRGATQLNLVLAAIRKLGLDLCKSVGKFIPAEYKEASVANRIALLQGLMDTDGTVSAKTNSVSFSTSSERLANDVQYVVRSIGGYAKITSKMPKYTYKGAQLTGKRAHRVWIRVPDPAILFRSNNHLCKISDYQYADCLRLKIKSIEPSRMAEAQCIALDDTDNLYLTNDFVVTHNTRTVEALAEVLHGNAKSLIRVDCGEYQQDHEVAKLIGAPPGYLGHRETTAILNQGALTRVQSEKCGISFVLFDEIEKASGALERLLLGICDKAEMHTGDNLLVNFESSMIFLTSNLGEQQIQQALNPHAMGFQKVEVIDQHKFSTMGERASKRRFSAAMMNRIDVQLTYKPLEEEHYHAILNHLMAAWLKVIVSGYGAKAFYANITPAGKAQLLNEGASVEYGARQLKRSLTKNFINPVCRMLLKQEIKPGAEVTLDSKAGKFKILVRNI